MELLVRNPGKLVSQRQVLQEVWGPQYERETDYLRVFIAAVRRKLEPEPEPPPLLHHRTRDGLPVRARCDLTGRSGPRNLPGAAPDARGRARACSCHARRPPPRRPPRPRARLRPRDPPRPPPPPARRPPPRAEAPRRCRRRRRARGLQLRQRGSCRDHVIELHVHDDGGGDLHDRVGGGRARSRPSRRRPVGPSPATAPTAPTSSWRAASSARTSVELRRPLRHGRGRPAHLALQVVDAGTGAPARRRRRLRLALHRPTAATRCTRTASPTRTSCAACRWPTPTATSASPPIYPGAYDGRWPHIHFEVFQDLDTATRRRARSSPRSSRSPRAPRARRTSPTATTASLTNLERPSLDERHGVQRRLREPAGHRERRPDQRLHGHPRRRGV